MLKSGGGWKTDKGITIKNCFMLTSFRIVVELHTSQVEVDALKSQQAKTASELDALLSAILDRAFKREL